MRALILVMDSVGIGGAPDAAHYGGSNTGNAGLVSAVVTAESPELHLVLPPLAALYLVPEV